jgi:hypothetical protein
MSMSINGEQIMEVFEIWAIERKSSDQETIRTVFTDENQARLDHKFFGGKLMVHNCYVAQGTEVEETATEDLING